MTPTWIEHAVEEGVDVLYLQGAWRLAHLPELARQPREMLHLRE